MRGYAAPDIYTNDNVYTGGVRATLAGSPKIQCNRHPAAPTNTCQYAGSAELQSPLPHDDLSQSIHLEFT